MEFKSNIDEKVYKKFISDRKGHFMQSYEWGEVAKYKNFTPHYVGMFEKNKMVCGALLLEKKMMKNISYFYCPRGYTIDYSNKDLLERFTLELKKYAKENNAIYIKIDPDIKRHTLDPEGNVVEGESNEDLMAFLNKLGYKHQGFNVDFDREQPRFTFRLKLEGSFEDIVSGFHSTSRKRFNKGNEYNLDIYKGTESDIEDFYTTMEETALRNGLGCNPINYYRKFYTILNKSGMSDIYVVKAHINDLKKLYKERIKEVQNSIEDLKNNPKRNESKLESKINELNKKIEKYEKELESVNAIDKKEVVLSANIIVKFNERVWTIHGGNSSCLRYLNSNYLITNAILKDVYNDGYKVIDFFGACGEANPKEDNPIAGLHNFKKSLGGEYTEFIGEYDLVVNPVLYNLYKVVIPVRRKIVKAKLKRKVSNNEEK